MTTMTAAKPKADKDLDEPPHRSRQRLDTMDRVRRAAAQLFREGRDGLRDVSDVSKLVNVLAVIGRMIEGSELEERLAALERRQP